MSDTAVENEVKNTIKVEQPKLWKVIFHNDDYTPFEFVIEILCKIFKYDLQGATEVALTVHQYGAKAVGIYSKEVADTKATQVITLARNNNFPLTVSVERE